MWIVIDIEILSNTYSFFNNTDPVGNSTSAGQEGQLELGDITLVDGSNNSQDDAYNTEELTKPNKYPKRTVHDQIKKRLGKKVLYL